MQHIPKEIILYLSKYCNFDTIISLLKTSKFYYESKQIYCTLISRTSSIIAHNKLCDKHITELKILFQESYNNVNWVYSHPDILDDKYLNTFTRHNTSCFIEQMGDELGIGHVLINKYSSQEEYTSTDSTFREYGRFTIEDVEMFYYFHQHHAVFLNPHVASEYLSKCDGIQDDKYLDDILIFMVMNRNKEHIFPGSLILWYDNCVVKTTDLLFNVLSLLKDHPNEYIQTVEKYLYDLTYYGKRCIHENLFYSILNDRNTECLKLLISFCMRKGIRVYFEGCSDPTGSIMENYILYLTERRYVLNSNNMLKVLNVLLSFDIKIPNSILRKTINISPMKFKLILPHCDHIDGLKYNLKDLPAFYNML